MQFRINAKTQRRKDAKAQRRQDARVWSLERGSQQGSPFGGRRQPEPGQQEPPIYPAPLRLCAFAFKIFCIVPGKSDLIRPEKIKNMRGELCTFTSMTGEQRFAGRRSNGQL